MNNGVVPCPVFTIDVRPTFNQKFNNIDQVVFTVVLAQKMKWVGPIFVFAVDIYTVFYKNANDVY